jgi:hypothetical protein
MFRLTSMTYIVKHLEALLTPAVFVQQKYYKQLELRDRILNLSLMAVFPSPVRHIQ